MGGESRSLIFLFATNSLGFRAGADMELIDPVKIYIAPTNSRAQMICRLLQTSGIEAFAGEDTSAVAGWWGGTIPGIFDAGVFVSRSDAERAAAIISQQENSEAERSKAEGLDIKSTCEECGKTSDFPEVQRGTVQTCPHCGALIDIGEMELPGDTEEEIENE